MGDIRIGFVNSYNDAEGTATIRYPDRGNEVTGEMLVLCPQGKKQKLEPEQMVLVAHLSSGPEDGVVLGRLEEG